jgi:acetyl esterase/lipase
MSRIRKTIARLIITLFGLTVLLIGGVIVAVNVSPRPFVLFVRRQFAEGIGVKPVTPAIYPELSQKVRAERDIEYPSRFKSNRLDIFSPKDSLGPFPTILWTHGGGFVGGDKAGIGTWATMIAANGYTVVSINYQRAPENHYPGPIIQLGEAYEFLQRDARRFPAVDLHRLIIGGDSAGAQIASQFTALQTNIELARSMQLHAIVPRQDLLAVILYCGPYDFQALYDSKSWFGRFLVRQLGWAYFDIRRWRDTPQAIQASTAENVTPDYPAAFITDGNDGSFEPDAKKLEAKLKEKGVHTDSLYYPAEHGKIGHEYQFDFSIPESMETYHRTLAFLAKVTEK